MNFFKTLSMCLIMSSGAAFAQDGGPGDPGDPGDSGDPSEPFDFISAWGMHPTDDSGMALLPNEDGGDLNEHGLHDVYDVGVSFVNDDAPSPSFEGFGMLEDLRLWRMPMEDSRTDVDLSEVGGDRGNLGFQGSATFVELLFMGRLSTYTGYDQIVTGILNVSRFDIQYPEEVVAGSMVLVPKNQWSSVDAAHSAMESMASASWHLVLAETEPVGTEGDVKDCIARWSADNKDCYADYIACFEAAIIKYRHCLDGIGFGTALDSMIAGGTGGGLLGGGIGVGVGVWGCGVGAAPAATVGGAIGGFLGGCGGLIWGTSEARGDCRETYLADRYRCWSQHKKCGTHAKNQYERCLNAIE